MEAAEWIQGLRYIGGILIAGCITAIVTQPLFGNYTPPPPEPTPPRDPNKPRFAGRMDR